MEAHILPAGLIDHGGVEAEGAVLGDAAAIDAGRHEKQAGHLLVECMTRETDDVGNRQRAHRDDDAGGIEPARDEALERGLAILHREFRSFAGGAEQGDPIATGRQQAIASRQQQLRIGVKIRGHRRCDGHQ